MEEVVQKIVSISFKAIIIVLICSILSGRPALKTARTQARRATLALTGP